MLAQEMERLAAIMARLRAEGGCPWDREQTHKTLKPYLIEEAYEVLEAIDASAVDKLQEELGDVLLQVVFHAQVAAEAGEFDLAAVAKTIADKLVRRHPHVFGEISVDGVAGVLANWERIKGHEYGKERTSVLAGVPAALPALMRAEKIQAKAARVGFDWPDVSGALVKVDEEMAEFREVLAETNARPERLREEFGDLLFALVNVARYLEIDAEDALRQTVDKFCRRFRYIEEKAQGQGRELTMMTLAEMDAIWEESKAGEMGRRGEEEKRRQGD